MEFASEYLAANAERELYNPIDDFMLKLKYFIMYLEVTAQFILGGSKIPPIPVGYTFFRNNYAY